MSTPIPNNRAAFTVAELGRACEGAELDGGGSVEGTVGVSTDSRREQPGELFVALRGERFDGHEHAQGAVQQGAVAVLVEERLELPGDVLQIVVPDSLVALGQLARFHRRRWAGPVIAIGGSAGKTTSKSAIAGALQAAFPGRVHATPGNLNNRIGAPMVLLALDPQLHDVAVIELGTNLRGEIALLVAAVEPSIGVLTLIAFEHAEGIGGIDAIEAEEGDLLAALPEHGVAVVNGDDPRVVRQLKRCPARTQLRYGEVADADYRLLERRASGVVGATLRVMRPSAGEILLNTPLMGHPGACATLAALAVSEVLSGPQEADELGAALAQGAVREAGRLVPVELADGTLVLDDTYNANPASVVSSLGVARELADARDSDLLVVLGEMRELGPTSAEEHQALADEVRRVAPHRLVAVSGDASFLHEACRETIDSVFAVDAAAAIEPTRERLRAGAVVLVKGSRGIGLERVVDALRRAGDQP